jgi:hypothetical protein
MTTPTTPRIDCLAALLESHDELDRLQGRLRTLGQRFQQARAYLAAPDANRHLALARIEQIRAQHSATLAALRGARREAHRRLGLAPAADRHHAA